MTERSEERLMRYLDGEATDAEAREVERWLAESAEARTLLRDLEAVGAAVRAIADERGTAADGIADAVMRKIGEERPAPRSLEEHRAKKSAGRRFFLAPAIGLSLAAAAAVVLFLKSPPGENPGEGAGAPAMPDPSGGGAESAGIAAVADDGTGAAIESVDFGAQNGTIFMVPSGPQVTPVVWLVDDGEATEG